MATIINAPGNRPDNENSMSGWVVAVLILVVVIGVGAYFWSNNQSTPAANPLSPTTYNSTTTNSSTNVTVTVPQSASSTP